MKLLMCNNCLDVFSLRPDITKGCNCGKVQGKYIDDLNAEYIGDATLIGFRNSSFRESLQDLGTDFIAFTIRKDCPTFKKKQL